MIKKLCIVTDRYPTSEYPLNTFLDQLVCAFADRGVACTVIAPYSRFRDYIKHNNYHPVYHYKKRTEKGAEIDVYCPRFLVLMGRKIGPIDFARSYQQRFEKTAIRTASRLGMDFDAFYGHFITPAGFAAVHMGQVFKKPSFIAYGECFIDQDSCNFTIEEIKERVSQAKGFIAVSTKNRDELIKYQIAEPEKIGIFPNAINPCRFFVINQKEARSELGFPQDAFIVAFVGEFNDRKGVRRVAQAIDQLGNINSVFIGSGTEEPDCGGILFKGRVPHDQIVKYLNAADVFVLPTLAEGCCNAIIEAMACGLPIISSDLVFNDDILDDSNSIRINPKDIGEIRDAIQKVYVDRELRKALSEGACKKAAELTIEQRANKILDYLEEKRKY